MATLLNQLKGMTLELEDKLRAQGIYNSDHLLAAARTPADRKALAEHAGVETRAILELANRSDLARIKGIGGVFSDLLEHAGVDTVKELATRNPDNLHLRILEVNAEQRLAGRVPTLEMVRGWVGQAKELGSVLEY